MKRAFAICIILALAATPALAQQQPAPDPAFLQKAIMALQAQRNTALDGQAAAEARANMLAEEAATLRKQLEEAKKPAEPAK